MHCKCSQYIIDDWDCRRRVLWVFYIVLIPSGQKKMGHCFQIAARMLRVKFTKSVIEISEEIVMIC